MKKVWGGPILHANASWLVCPHLCIPPLSGGAQPDAHPNSETPCLLLPLLPPLPLLQVERSLMQLILPMANDLSRLVATGAKDFPQCDATVRELIRAMVKVRS